MLQLWTFLFPTYSRFFFIFKQTLCYNCKGKGHISQECPANTSQAATSPKVTVTVKSERVKWLVAESPCSVMKIGDRRDEYRMYFTYRSTGIHYPSIVVSWRMPEGMARRTATFSRFVIGCPRGGRSENICPGLHWSPNRGRRAKIER